MRYLFYYLEIMCEGNNLLQMVKRAMKTSDPLLMKLVKTISSHDGKCKELFANNPTIVAEIVRMTKGSASSGIIHS